MDGEPSTATAWLERSTGPRVDIRGVCSIGRSTKNQIVIDDDRASRRHAMINAQGLGEFWLIDLGSVNGSQVNGRRVIQPCRLNDGDKIEIGGSTFTFRHPPTPEAESSSRTADMTRQDIRSVNCWLLVADIEDSTHLLQKYSPEQASRITGRWLGDCKQIVEENRGSINKFLGDGFFAFWVAGDGLAEAVAKAFTALKNLQQGDAPRFRVVLHFGSVLLGGAASLGEDCLMGSEVNFAFRMEKLAASLRERFLLSGPAKDEIGAMLHTSAKGEHPVPSFDGRHPFFTA